MPEETRHAAHPTASRWDLWLRDRLARGEEAVLGELYDRFAPLLFGLAQRMTGDNDAAEDVTGAVLTRVWQNPESFDPERGTIRAWISTLTRRLALQQQCRGPCGEVLTGESVQPPAERTEKVAAESHAAGCPRCRAEPLRPRHAAGWPYDDEPRVLPSRLRTEVLRRCLTRRPAQVPVPSWASPFHAETARLDRLLRDLGATEWQLSVKTMWRGGVSEWSIPALLCHLTAMDGMLSETLHVADPVPAAPQERTPGHVHPAERRRAEAALLPMARTQRLIDEYRNRPPAAVREFWRQHTRQLVRAAACDGQEAATLPVPASTGTVKLGDALLERAFSCWIHASEMADSVGEVYPPPEPVHLHAVVEHVVKRLPAALAGLRCTGRARHQPGSGRVVPVARLELDGPGGGEWLVPLYRGGRAVPAEEEVRFGLGAAREVAHVVTEGPDFCRLAAGRVAPGDLVHVGVGDPTAVHDLLHAAGYVGAGSSPGRW